MMPGVQVPPACHGHRDDGVASDRNWQLRYYCDVELSWPSGPGPATAVTLPSQRIPRPNVDRLFTCKFPYSGYHFKRRDITDSTAHGRHLGMPLGPLIEPGLADILSSSGSTSESYPNTAPVGASEPPRPPAGSAPRLMLGLLARVTVPTLTFISVGPRPKINMSLHDRATFLRSPLRRAYPIGNEKACLPTGYTGHVFGGRLK
jgi:hypothetical protein